MSLEAEIPRPLVINAGPIEEFLASGDAGMRTNTKKPFSEGDADATIVVRAKGSLLRAASEAHNLTQCGRQDRPLLP